jgi:hypothetical protein
MTKLRYFENPLEEAGFRFIGYADKLNNFIRHKGWYTDDDLCLGTYRGAVFLTSGKSGKSRAICGYLESDNGGYVLDLSETYEIEPDFYGFGCHSYNANDAASFADDLAKREAEKSTEYNRDWFKGQQFNDNLDFIEYQKDELKAILKERRKAKNAINSDSYPNLCAALEKHAKSLIEKIKSTKAENQEILSNVWIEEAFLYGASLEEMPS